jgi:transglutaminase-like putative cysteine protease
MQALARIPRITRDSRDTLFLLATIAAVTLPHGDHLPLWATALTGLILAWRAWLALSGRALPGRWVLVAVLLLMGGLTWLTHRTLMGREPGITMLVMLMALKSLELRARRDAFVVFFLGFFLVLTQFLYSQSMLMALWMLLSVWALLSAVVLAQMPVGQPSLALAARLALRTCAVGLPVMVGLFLLFPRIAPLWGIPAETLGRTGLSSQMAFGAMSEIASDDSIALRLRFDNPGNLPPPPEARYFRGPVLGAFDGRLWTANELAYPGAADPLTLSGTPLRYEITVEPARIKVLPLLEMAPGAAGSGLEAGGITVKRGPELDFAAARPIAQRLRLNTSAYLDYRAGPLENTLALQSNLSLPPSFNPRTMEWAAKFRRQRRFADLTEDNQAEVLASAVLDYIRTNDYSYTLAPGRYGETSKHVIDEFWLDRRLGFCEHFAAAFVVVMRALDVPARVVTGYQGMDAEPVDGYWIVRNSNAHAWAEYWTPARGWVRADPTAAVAPGRVLQGQSLRAPTGAFAGALNQLSPALWPKLRASWEAVNNRWQQLVLNYSREDQFNLLKNLGVEQPDWLALGRVGAAVIAVLALAGGVWTWWSGRPHDAWSRQRAQVLRQLRRWGVADAAAHQAPRRWAALLSARHGAAAAPAADLLVALENSRYASMGSSSNWLARRRWHADFRRAGRMLASKLD